MLTRGDWNLMSHGTRERLATVYGRVRIAMYRSQMDPWMGTLEANSGY